MKREKIKPPEIRIKDDGLFTPEVGDWAEEKYRLLWNYADLFATSMKNKWEERGFIDLFAAAGHARLRGTSQVIQSSSLLALQVTNPFDFYIFCDSEPKCISALIERVTRLKPSSKCHFKNCDVNESHEVIMSDLPEHGPKKRVLSFCFVDPCKLSDIKFLTIRKLANRFVDFLIHIPAMDPIRNEGIYFADDSTIVAEYLGLPKWRDIRRQGNPAVPFDLFIANMVDAQMKELGFVYGGISENVMIRSTEKNLPLYRLGFYSRNRLGEKFWKEAKRYSNAQISLF